MPEAHSAALARLINACADDKLMLGHRNADWTGLGPILEEDIAFSSLAQDNMAHALALYELAAGILDTSADDLAFGRTAEEYLCAHIVEVPDNFDYATALGRQFFCAHFDLQRLRRFAQSTYEPLAKLAARMAAEEQVQVEHVDGWLERLGSDEGARARLQRALDLLAQTAVALFEPVHGQETLESDGAYPLLSDDAFAEWERDLRTVTDRAGIALTIHRPDAAAIGGRRGHHTPDFDALLDDMCAGYRVEPGAQW